MPTFRDHPPEGARRRILRRVSFGSTSAVITSIGLVVAFGSDADATLIASLLVVGIADNLTDSLSVHLYQEAEGLEQHEAFTSTVTNFLTRLGITASFVALVAVLNGGWLIAVTVSWGLAVLGLLTTALAHERGASVGRELARHYTIAVVVIVLSRAIGDYVNAHIK
jgi:hypothetical protein